jgi:membrane protein YdbS with pleckstrin-like domain
MPEEILDNLEEGTHEKPKEEVKEIVPIPYSEFQSVGHFCLLCFLSLGIYPFFWFYKHWRYLKDEKEMDIMPGFRVLFSFIYGFSLFSTFQDLAKAQGYKNRFPMAVFFLLYLIALLTVYLHDILSALAFFSFVFLIPPLNMMNYYYLKEQPKHPVKTKLSKDELIFLGIIWALIVISMFN